MVIRESSLDDARRAAQCGATSYVGHPATAELVGVPVNRGEYIPADGDIAYVIRLKHRQPVPGGDKEVVPEELEVLEVRYVSTAALYSAAIWGGAPAVEKLLFGW
ncbi:MAG: hypothetical protein RMI00_06540 [Sulfolobales archaeon]|nr:hypothetical protein [Sulfolobales archaeon]